MKKYLFFIVGIVLPFSYVLSQSNYHPLRVGDTLPEIIAVKTLHPATGEASTTTLADYNNKLLVLDFLHTTCKSCVAALDDFYSLQRSIPQLKILAVTSQSAKEVNEYFTLSNHDKKRVPDFIVSDSLLKKYFPHQYISHLVWIDGNRVTRAITDKDYLTRENINKIICGRTVNWPQKLELVNFNYQAPLLQSNKQASEQNQQPAFYSALLPYINGVDRKLNIATDSANNLQRITLFNFSIIDLYLYACGRYGNFPNSHIQFETPDLTRFYYHPLIMQKRSWSVDNEYCYEVVMPLHYSAEEKENYMRSDLDNKLGLQVCMQNRKRQCLVLLSKNNDDKLLQLIDPQTVPAALRKNYTPLSELLAEMNNCYTGWPVLNETTHEEKMLLPFRITDFKNVPAINQQLAAVGLQLIPAERTIPVLHIQESHTIQ